MNTIRRTITVQTPCLGDKTRMQTDELSFEGEKGLFHLGIEHFNPFEGYNRTRIKLSKEQAETLYKSLSRFLDKGF